MNASAKPEDSRHPFVASPQESKRDGQDLTFKTVSESLSFESWVMRLAALEAVLGLLIEISFIATQRLFGAK